jgi:MoaA/NifB/PqqE/SkfB family radical SAM enzyme
MVKNLDSKEALILERSIRLLKYLFLNEPQPPFKLILTPTDRCNLNCFFCPNFVARKEGRFKPEDEMIDDEWISIIDQGIKLGVRQWCLLGGGEPLLRREIILPLLEKIKRKSPVIDLEIITNGTLFTKEIIEELVKTCKERIRNGEEKTAIQTTISIHGGERTFHEITGASLYETVINNVKLITKLKKGAKLKYFIVQINIVVNKRNLNEIENFISTLANIGVDQVALHPIHVYEETKEIIKNEIPATEEYESILRFVKKLMPLFPDLRIDTLSLTSYLQQFNPKFKHENYDNKVENKTIEQKYDFLKFRCFEPWYDMLINPDGRVGRCAAFVTRNEPISVKRESLGDVWFGDFLNKVRLNVRNGILMEGCSPCALMSNTIVIKRELEKLIEINPEDITQVIKEAERLVNEFYLHLY